MMPAHGQLETWKGHMVRPMRHGLVRDMWVTITKVSQASEAWSDHPRSALARLSTTGANLLYSELCAAEYSAV